MSLAGIDEAGRGPVLGPLVVAAIRVKNDKPLRELDVKDSKKLSPQRREELAPEIRKVAERVEVRVIEASELNARMPRENLNQIEVTAFAELLDRIAPATKSYLDACDVDAERFARNIRERAKDPGEIHAEHEADARHPVVAAASIIAKVTRDEQMARIRTEHGECGSGYSHDATTQEWLAAYVRKNNALPSIARREWETSRRLLQRDLTAFLGPPQTPPPAKPSRPRPRSTKR